mmetsp:Transcript_39720/g.68575  ORF Transcript_39720/g.68575 Transcript_39720/m.68575 type:complete len:98 (-) Transcript_39720:231-524(-)
MRRVDWGLFVGATNWPVSKTHLVTANKLHHHCCCRQQRRAAESDYNEGQIGKEVVAKEAYNISSDEVTLNHTVHLGYSAVVFWYVKVRCRNQTPMEE